MNWRYILFLLAMLAPGQLRAETFPVPSITANQLCRPAIMAAERAHGIPSHLLAAIARVESGRRDRSSGSFDPWPWTINMDGAGSFYDSKTQAVAAAVSMRPQATKSIDVGCMQISLTHHPNAFATLDQAFDPWANADYGARFLAELYQKSGSWAKAVELYHSNTQEIGAEYGRRVYAALPEELKLADASHPLPPATGGWASPVNRTLLTGPLAPPPPHIIPLVPGPSGGAPAGRTLESYRSAPVRFAVRGL